MLFNEVDKNDNMLDTMNKENNFKLKEIFSDSEDEECIVKDDNEEKININEKGFGDEIGSFR